jgi:hypothetical protein
VGDEKDKLHALVRKFSALLRGRDRRPQVKCPKKHDRRPRDGATEIARSCALTALAFPRRWDEPVAQSGWEVL